MQLDISNGVILDKYKPYTVNYKNRYEVYYGGAGSGKSYFVTQKILVKCLTDKRKILVVRKVGATLRDSVWQLFLDIIGDWELYNLVKINKSEFSITFLHNDSKILCKGLDDPEKIKSIAGITDIWIEEATELKEEDFMQLDLRMRSTADSQQIYLSFNPVSKVNWVYRKWFADKTIKHKNTLILKSTYKDNNRLPKEYIEQLENKINNNPYWYKVYALGEFATLDKLVFNNFEIKDFDKKIKGKHIVGMDFGFTNDPSTIIDSVVDDKNKIIYVCNEYFAEGKTNDELAKQVKDMGLSKSIIYADSAEQKSIEEIKRYGIYNIHPAKKGPDSVIHGIQSLQQYKIIIHPSCEQIAIEFNNYTWQKDKKTDEYINKPIDDYNHGIDALRYSLQCLTNTVNVLDKDYIFGGKL